MNKLSTRQVSEPHKIYCHGELSLALRPFISKSDLVAYLKTIPVGDFPKGGESFEVHFSNGVCVCSVGINQKTATGKLEFIKLTSCKLKTTTPKTTSINFHDIDFPGEQEIVAFLTIHLTGRYKLGTVLEIHFSNADYVCTLGVSSCKKREKVVGTLTPSISEVVTGVLENILKI